MIVAASINKYMKKTIKSFMEDYFFTLIIVMSLPLPIVSCGIEKIGKQKSGTTPSGLHAVLYPESDSFRSSREGRVNARIINDGTGNATVDMWSLGQSMTALIVTSDSTGERMLTVGPSMPRSPEEMKKYITILKPGDTIEISYTLHVFSPELPRGRYLVRMASIPSNNVAVIIK